MRILLILSILWLMVNLIWAGVPKARFDALINQQTFELGLYNSSDKVNILTDSNFDENVLGQHRASLVEFYNSYCGHCKRFAPSYKQLAEEIYSWRDVLLVSAIDCADVSNNGICRDYEVMGYPTIRYMGPGFALKANDFGKNIDSQILDEIKNQLANLIAEENRTDLTAKWPNFQLLSEAESLNLFENQPIETKIVVIVFEPEGTTIGIQTILHFSRYSNASIRRVTDLNVASKYQIDKEKVKIATINREGEVAPYSPLNSTVDSYVETIKDIFKNQNFDERQSEYIVIKRNATALNSQLSTEQTEDTLKEVLKNKHLVYQADLEMAIKGLLFNEIPRVRNISGERLLALQKLLTVLDRYNPLGENGRSFLKQILDYVLQFNQDMTGMMYEAKLKQLEKDNAPVFSSNHFVGCAASQPQLRGYTCSLWELFHFLTVQSAESEITQDPLESLQAIHGYVKYFFGCSECSNHFQAMAVRRNIWSTPNKDEAILWLWAAHNEVNKRLAGDATEDPKFPKIQFPSEESCPACYKQPMSAHPNLEISWDKDAVLQFLKDIHNPANISRLGVENESLLHPSLEKLRSKRMIGNVFSDIDMRMGIMLYGFCVVMMVGAFKLFVYKGYRKKPYSHDILGKV